ncbi:MAG: hypothetical protein JXA52_02435 [Planctomycetes bacterium]|nr:hypothetical protein [Planctomycetota bacterium]
MNDKIQKLLVLQRNDTEFIAVQRRMKTGPEEMVKAQENLAQAQKAFEKKAAELKEVQIAADAEEMEVKQSEAEIEKQKEKLGVVKNSKEYNIVRTAISVADKHKSEHETIELQYLEKIDAIKADLKSLEAKRDQAAAELESFKKEFMAEEKMLRGKAAELKAKRKLCTKNIDPEDLELYETALRRNHGVAMALMKDGACQGCFRQPIRNVQNQVLLNRDLIACQDCGRILYIAEQEEPVE